MPAQPKPPQRSRQTFSVFTPVEGPTTPVKRPAKRGLLFIALGAFLTVVGALGATMGGTKGAAALAFAAAGILWIVYGIYFYNKYSKME